MGNWGGEYMRMEVIDMENIIESGQLPSIKADDVHTTQQKGLKGLAYFMQDLRNILRNLIAWQATWPLSSWCRP